MLHTRGKGDFPRARPVGRARRPPSPSKPEAPRVALYSLPVRLVLHRRGGGGRAGGGRAGVRAPQVCSTHEVADPSATLRVNLRANASLSSLTYWAPAGAAATGDGRRAA